MVDIKGAHGHLSSLGYFHNPTIGCCMYVMYGYLKEVEINCCDYTAAMPYG